MEQHTDQLIIDLIDRRPEIETVLPAELRVRIRDAKAAARNLQRAVDSFSRDHGSVFRDYANLVDDSDDVSDAAWESVDRQSGYVALWISILASEAMLAAVLDVSLPTMISPSRGASPLDREKPLGDES